MDVATLNDNMSITILPQFHLHVQAAGRLRSTVSSSGLISRLGFYRDRRELMSSIRSSASFVFFSESAISA